MTALGLMYSQSGCALDINTVEAGWDLVTIIKPVRLKVPAENEYIELTLVRRETCMSCSQAFESRAARHGGPLA